MLLLFLLQLIPRLQVTDRHRFRECGRGRDGQRAGENGLQIDVRRLHDGADLLHIFLGAATIGHKASQLRLAQAQGKQLLRSGEAQRLSPLNEAIEIVYCFTFLYWTVWARRLTSR